MHWRQSDLGDLNISDFAKNEIDIILDALPHGSGINGRWYVDIPKHGNKVMFCNTYSLLNEYGMYIQHIDFSITLPMVSLGDSDAMVRDFKLQFHSDGITNVWYYVRRYGLREYLEETVCLALDVWYQDEKRHRKNTMQ